MTKHILFLAVSATLGVTANSFFQFKLLLLILLFFVFLYVRFNGNSKTLFVHFMTLMLFYAAAYSSDVGMKRCIPEKKKVFRLPL